MSLNFQSLKNVSPRQVVLGVGAVLLAVIVVVFCYRLYGRFAGQGGYHFPTPVVEAIEAKTEKVDVTVSALGTLQADQAITVTPEITGIVTSIDFEDGERIEQGDVIITI